MDYLNFDLSIGKFGAQYVAKVLVSPSGESAGAFTLPFASSELFAPTAGSVTPQQVGNVLFKAIFAGEIYACLQRSLDAVKRQSMGLRIRLRLNDAPELTDYPWELLYDKSRDKFIALSNQTSIVRYLELPEPAEWSCVATLPLRILVIIANPKNSPQLDVEKERQQLQNVFHNQATVKIELLRPATKKALQQRLSDQKNRVHVIHFIGHGLFEQTTQEAALVFEDEAGNSDPIKAEELVMLLHDYPPNLIFLNACESATAGQSNLFCGTAQKLAQQRIPVVIAMQGQIVDQDAIAFAREFYERLADRWPVDAALAEARKAFVLQRSRERPEWGIPVLFMRVNDGHLFDTKAQQIRAPVTPMYQQHVASFVSTAEYWRSKGQLQNVSAAMLLAGRLTLSEGDRDQAKSWLEQAHREAIAAGRIELAKMCLLAQAESHLQHEVYPEVERLVKESLRDSLLSPYDRVWAMWLRVSSARLSGIQRIDDSLVAFEKVAKEYGRLADQPFQQFKTKVSKVEQPSKLWCIEKLCQAKEYYRLSGLVWAEVATLCDKKLKLLDLPIRLDRQGRPIDYEYTVESRPFQKLRMDAKNELERIADEVKRIQAEIRWWEGEFVTD